MAHSPSAADSAAPAASRLSRLSRWLRPVLVVLLLTFATAVVFGNVLPTRAELAATQRRLDAQRAENERLRRRIVESRAEADGLAKDPWQTERILHDDLNMSAPDKVIVR